MINKDLSSSMLSLTQDMIPVVQNLLTTRPLYCPDDLKQYAFNRAYQGMINPSTDFFCHWTSQQQEELRSALEGHFKKFSIYNGHKFILEFVIDRYNVFAQVIDKGSLSYESKQSVKKQKINALDGFLDSLIKPVMREFEPFMNDQDGSLDPLLMATNNGVNLLSAAKTFMDAANMKENNKLEGVVGELSYLLSACLVIDAMSNFVNSEANKYEIIKQAKRYVSALAKSFSSATYNSDYFKKLHQDKVYSIEKVFLAFTKIRKLFFGDFYQEVQKALKTDILPVSLINSNAISKIISYWENRRVDTMKEAINLYFMEIQQDEKIEQIHKEYQDKINKINSEVELYKQNVENRINSMNSQQEELIHKHNKMVEENKKLQKEHEQLVDEHNDLVEEHNKIVDELNER